MHTHSRRGFLARTLGAGWFSATLMERAYLRAAAARASAPGAAANLFDIERVAEGVYAAIAQPVAVINCNAAIFERAEDLLVVDTHSKLSAVAALVAQIRREVSTKPVRYIVETHFHWDHTQGAAEYKRLAPEAHVIASTATHDLIAKFGAALLKESIEEIPKSIEDSRKKLDAAKNQEEKAFYQRLVSEMKAFETEMRGVPPVLPDLTFSDNLVLHDNAQELHLAFRGRGHTAGDVVVFSPTRKAIATGDLAHCWLPYLADAYPKEWPATIAAVEGFEFDAIVGGHGEPQRSRERMNQFSAYIRELTEAVDAGKRAGRPVAQLQAAISPASLKSLGGGYAEFVGAQITKYDGPQGRTAPADAVAAGVKSNIAEIFTALDRA